MLPLRLQGLNTSDWLNLTRWDFHPLYFRRLTDAPRPWREFLQVLVTHKACTVADLMDDTALYACLWIDCSYGFSDACKTIYAE